ncbi:MAG: F0F1 ATP synthase subunit A [Dehalococcoidia bacterium]
MGRLLRRPRVLVIIFLVLGSLVLGQTLFRFPFPPISIKPEKLGHDLFPLGAIGDFDLTNTMLSAWIGMVLLLIMAYFATRRMGLIPVGWQNFVEAVVEWFYGLVETIAGPRNARRFFPLVATIFFFVIVSNWISLFPGFGTIGRIESAEEVIEEVVEDKAGDNDISVRDAEVQLEEFLHLSEEERAARPEHLGVGAEIFEELEDLDLQLLDEVSFFRVLPLSLNDQTISAVEYLENPPEGKSAGFLIPLFRNANTALNTTLAIALIGMFMVEFWGIRTLGFFRYTGRFVALGTLFRGKIGGGLIDLFVGALEGISEVARVISFTFRLFGNMFAGEILIFVMSFLIPLVLVVPFYGLELFIGFIQAIIFAVLTLIFAVIAVTAHNGHEEEAEEREPPQTAHEG